MRLLAGESRLVCGGRQLGSAVAGGGDPGGSEKAVGGFVGRGCIPGGIQTGAGIGNPFSRKDAEAQRIFRQDRIGARIIDL